MSSMTELLSQFLIVPGVKPETLAEIGEFSEIKRFSANDIVYREHEDSRRLYVVVSGQVDVQYLLQDGRRKTLDTCCPGDFLLWSALVPPHQTNSIGICRVETEVLSIDGKKLLELCERDTDFGYRVMSLVATVIRRRLQASRYQLSFHTL